MINTNNYPDRHTETISPGKDVAFCRCWQSSKFPYCDGTHRQMNADTGDQLGPVIVTVNTAEETA